MLTIELNKKHGNKTHGMSRTPTYNAWTAMNARCNNSKTFNWAYYGGRGIKVCKRWRKFENFLADMGLKPKEKSLDRIDNNGNYEPGNCRWATIDEQNNNMRSNIRIKHNSQVLTLKQFAETYKFDYELLQSRVTRLKWPLRKALTTPRQRNKLKKTGTASASAWGLLYHPCAHITVPGEDRLLFTAPTIL